MATFDYLRVGAETPRTRLGSTKIILHDYLFIMLNWNPYLAVVLASYCAPWMTPPLWRSHMTKCVLQECKFRSGIFLFFQWFLGPKSYRPSSYLRTKPTIQINSLSGPGCRQPWVDFLAVKIVLLFTSLFFACKTSSKPNFFLVKSHFFFRKKTQHQLLPLRIPLISHIIPLMMVQFMLNPLVFPSSSHILRC